MSELPSVSLRRQVSVASRLLPHGGRPDSRKYVVFAQGRTGSTLLGDLIASHPDAVFGDEILQAKVLSSRLWVEGHRHCNADKVYGFHVKIYQLTDVQGVRDPGGWLRRMHASGWRVIALRRRNLLRHVLSNMAITATGVTHHRSGSGDRQPLTIDTAELLHWMRQREMVGEREREALAGVPHVAVTYEDDLLDPDVWPATTARVFAHLDLDPAHVTTSLRRTNPGPLSDLVTNLDEVASALRGTPYERFLDP